MDPTFGLNNEEFVNNFLQKHQKGGIYDNSLRNIKSNKENRNLNNDFDKMNLNDENSILSEEEPKILRTSSSGAMNYSLDIKKNK